jgi:secreted trypsin-like serine protease
MMLQNASRNILVLGVILGTTACDGSESGSDSTGQGEAPIANGIPAGGVGVVRLGLSDGTTSAVCTGTVISDGRVLTAGHCVDDWLTIRAGRGVTVLLQGDLLGFAEYTQDGTNWTCLNDGSNVCSNFFDMHVTRMGNADIPPDIAVVRFAAPFQGISSGEYRELSTGSVRVKQQLEEWGAGRTSAAGTAGGAVSRVMMRALVRVASVQSTSIKTSDNNSQVCHGDSGGPIFAGPSDLVVGVLSTGSKEVGQCDAVNGQATWPRITPAVIDFINNNRQGSDPVCSETIPGTGFQACF